MLEVGASVNDEHTVGDRRGHRDARKASVEPRGYHSHITRHAMALYRPPHRPENVRTPGRALLHSRNRAQPLP